MALLMLAQAAQPAADRSVARATQAKVTLRIRHAAVASDSDWRKAPPASRREIERKDESGRTIVIRVIEYQ